MINQNKTEQLKQIDNQIKDLCNSGNLSVYGYEYLNKLFAERENILGGLK